MTPEQIENKLNETVNTIEQAVEDIRTNKASRQEVVELIDDRTKSDKEMLEATKTDIETLNTGIAEMKEATDALQTQVRTLSKAGITARLGTKNNYKGYFSSPAEAKAFALLIMAATTCHSRVSEHHDRAKKALDDIGLEPHWLNADGRKAMTGSSQTGGGALVTVEQIPTIMMLLEQYGKFRANAQVMPMGAGQTLTPKIDGLLAVTCPGEGGTINEQDPEIDIVSLLPKTLSAITCYSMELEDDSLVALGEMLAGLFARSFAYYEDLCGFKGDGTSTYFGYTGIAGALRAVDATIANIKSLVVGAGNAYSELTLANFEEVAGTAPVIAEDEFLKWYVHKYFFWTVMVKLALAAGSGTATEILTGQALKQKTYLGYSVEFAQVMPKAEANSQICALLANLKQGAILGTRGGIEFATSSERYFEKGVIGVRGRDRIAINAHGVGDTTDAGPICALITAAS